MDALLSANQYISSSGIVTVYLLLIVFAVLAFLVVVLSIGHKAMEGAQKKIAAAKEKRLAAKADAKKSDLPASPAVPLLQEEDEAEVVAAITAAITMILQSEAPQKKANFVVRKIERM